MKSVAFKLVLLAWLAGSWGVSAKMTPEQVKSLPPAASHKVNFTQEIKPLLETSCMKCHGRGKTKGDFVIDTRETFLKAAHSGPAVVVGKSEESYLIELVAGFDPDTVMPQKGSKLKPAQISLLRAWIDQGLPWDKEVSFGKLTPVNLTPTQPAVPRRRSAGNAIDAFLQPYFTANKIAAPKLADDRAFARRIYLDVIGVLPTPEELDAFLADKRGDKREQLAAKLLGDNRRYAENWMTFWNDLLRNDYQGTGYIDGGRKQISGWLYSALATNMPYNQFVAQLINPSADAEGFTKGIVWRGVVNASQTPQMQAAQNISQVFMGVNLKCASCHDSFINDWTLADAYGLASIYADGPLELVHCDKPTGKTAAMQFIYPELGAIDASLSKTNRLQRLAEVITQKQNGRLTRTIVNRLWARFMGRGLVEPVDEMENQAWHPELLDWLASDLAANGYDLKRTISTIITSQAYQYMAVPVNEQNRQAFVFQGPLVRRLSAEQFRDAITELTGVGYTMATADADFSAGVPPEQLALKTKPIWIWSQTNHFPEVPLGSVYFRKHLMLLEIPDVAIATLTADNNFTLYVNGKKTKSGKEWNKPVVVDLRPLFTPGTNVLAVVATNEGEGMTNKTKANPAGFIFYGQFRHERIENGKKVGYEAELISDGTWLSSTQQQKGWETVAFKDTDWKPAGMIGLLGIEPWSLWNLSKTFAGAATYYGRVRTSLVPADALTVALGRPNREQVVTTRASAATTLQALELTNGAELAKIMQFGAQRRVAEKGKTPNELIDWVYAQALSRKPTAAEARLAGELIGSPAKKEGVEDLLWAVTMLPEFQLIY